MSSVEISMSVGREGANQAPDVRAVQGLLNFNLFRLTPLMPLKVDGLCGPLSVGMISEFQRRILNFSQPDGRVDPKGKTLASLNEANPNSDKPQTIHGFSHDLLDLQQWVKRSTPPPDTPLASSKSLTEQDYTKAALTLGVEVPTLKAVALVESRGSGFLGNGEPKILFEGHWFHRFTEGKYDSQHPTISYPRWTKAHYLGGIKEYSRYRQALSLDPDAAMKSTSWGKFQIMGFNYKDAGYSSVQGFVDDMKKFEGHHLNALVGFIKSNRMAEFLKNKEWAKFARAYNGPGYSENQYDVKLEQAYKTYAGTK